MLQSDNSKPNNKPNKITFIGKESCIDCHKEEFNLWQHSDHSKAMAIATDSSVLGNFDNSKFVTSNGKETFFYKKKNKFFVKTEGVGGKIQDFEITHTFGYYPLQQYLIPFKNGKYQCLPIAWNSKKEEWYSLPEMIYPHENLTPTNWLHWTNAGQNWNGMCAECHSTNLKKNFDPETKKFNTTYSEINVSCEACHGPGSMHKDWANLPKVKRVTDSTFGLIVKTSRINNREYIENCTRCHSRRSQFNNFEHGRKHLLDSMLPELLTESYQPDGQILDEDYVYGSFLQSKMYANGVKCNDCHNVHSGKTLYQNNKLCHKCHEPNIYDTKKHHFHKYKDEKGKPIILSNKKIEVGKGALCVNCHMPGQYYMGIDFRRDHSIRIPRPDLTISIKTPNACNNCHSDKTPQWANSHINKWYRTKRTQHYGTTFASARKSEPKAEKDLIKIAKDKMLPIIVRATAFSLMNRYNSEAIKKTVQFGLKEAEASIREAALRVYSNSNMTEFKRDLLELLNDSVKAVRAEAAIRISELPKDEIPTDYVNLFNKALTEYKEMNLYMADFPSGRMNLGIMYANQNKLTAAAKQYEEAIKVDSLFFPAKANLAIIYNQLDKNDKAEILLRDLVKNHHELSESYYYLGLLLAEKKNFTEAIKYMKKASELIPKRVRINYNIGLMLQNLGKIKEAEKELKKALKKEPTNFDFLYALADHYIKRRKYSKAEMIALKLKELYPSNSLADQILSFITKEKQSNL